MDSFFGGMDHGKKQVRGLDGCVFQCTEAAIVSFVPLIGR